MSEVVLPLDETLQAVGDLLAAEGEHVAIVVVGGATLNLLGLVSRTTADVDVIAQATFHDGELRLLHADPFPPALANAIATVGRDFGLPKNWMNAQVAQQWLTGLPPSTAEGITWRTYGGLDVGLVGRQTLIALKLAAVVDSNDTSKHTQDLLALKPLDTELQEAAEWVLTQDAGEAHPRRVAQAVEYVRRHRA